MLKNLASASQSKIYWILLIILGVALEAVALYFQYALDEWPCVLCIHVRIWVMAFIIVSLIALFVRNNPLMNRVAHLFMLLSAIGLAERSWQLLAVERGWVFGACDMDLGVPAWFALDKWFPLIFEVQASCGYTPQLLLGVTMAEALMVLSIIMSLVAAALSVGSLLQKQTIS